MSLAERVRNYLIENTSVPEAAFIYETENFTMTEELPYVVKEWSLADVYSRLTDETKRRSKMVEFDVMQPIETEEDLISEPAEEIADALQDYLDEEVWDAQVETTHPDKGRISILTTFKLIK